MQREVNNSIDVNFLVIKYHASYSPYVIMKAVEYIHIHIHTCAHTHTTV